MEVFGTFCESFCDAYVRVFLKLFLKLVVVFVVVIDAHWNSLDVVQRQFCHRFFEHKKAPLMRGKGEAI